MDGRKVVSSHPIPSFMGQGKRYRGLEIEKMGFGHCGSIREKILFPRNFENFCTSISENFRGKQLLYVAKVEFLKVIRICQQLPDGSSNTYINNAVKYYFFMRHKEFFFLSHVVVGYVTRVGSTHFFWALLA